MRRSPRPVSGQHSAPRVPSLHVPSGPPREGLVPHQHRERGKHTLQDTRREKAAEAVCVSPRPCAGRTAAAPSTQSNSEPDKTKTPIQSSQLGERRNQEIQKTEGWFLKLSFACEISSKFQFKINFNYFPKLDKILPSPKSFIVSGERRWQRFTD